MVKTKGKSASEQLTLTVARRAAQGRGPVRRLRTGGHIPGIVYGHAVEPVPISVEAKALGHVLRTKAGEHALITLRLDGEGWERPVLLKGAQHDAVDGHLLHVDFQVIALTQKIKVKIPVALHGVPVGVKQEGGILEHFLREVEVECLPTEIPEQIAYDVSAMSVGQTVHVRDLQVPPTVRIVTDPDGAIASVQTPKAEPEPEAAAAEAVTEPEVIREKKPEEGEAAAEAGKTAEPEKKEPKADKAK